MKQAFLVCGVPCATPGARALGVDLFAYLARHASGDWGDLDPQNWVANEEASLNELPVMSRYQLDGGKVLWVITDAERSTTTFLVPTEYRATATARPRRLKRAS